MNRSLKWEFWICIAFLLIGVVATFDDRPTLKNIKTTIITEPYAAGQEALGYRFSAEILRNCKGNLIRALHQNGEIYYLPTRHFSWIPEDEWTQLKAVSFIVPVDLGPLAHILEAGPASYHVTEQSSCNRLQAWFGRVIETKYPPVHFTVSANGDEYNE